MLDPSIAPQALLTIGYNCATLTLRRSAQFMPGHKFHLGDIVELEQSRSRWASGGIYEVTKQLPKSDAGEYEYRIKSSHESHERVVLERELSIA